MHLLLKNILEENKAIDIITVDLLNDTFVFDKLLVASGYSQRHICIMSNIIEKELNNLGYKCVSIEGRKMCDWILLDLGDIIVHLFFKEVRSCYNIEEFWKR